MSPWGFGRRGARPTDTTWLPEDLELAPDWVRDEMFREPEEIQEWLTHHQPEGGKAGSSGRGSGGKRGRRPKE